MKIINTFLFCLIFIANVFSQTDFERRTSISDVIVEGKVIKKHSYWNANRSKIFTSNKIEITKIFKGLNYSTTIEFVTVGGVVDNQFQFEIHSTQIGVGQVGIFFLQNFPLKTHFLNTT